MMISLASAGGVAASAGACALRTAMLFGAVPIAHAALAKPDYLGHVAPVARWNHGGSGGPGGWHPGGPPGSGPVPGRA
jgi:hypothetical protein